MTIRPLRRDLLVFRHAPFPSTTPWVLREGITGVPINLTGATITLQARLYEGAASVQISADLPLVDAVRGKFGPPALTETEHEALIAGALADSQTLQGRLRLFYDVKFEDVVGFPSAFIGVRGFYDVQTGVNT
jgi:hypothetical protein